MKKIVVKDYIYGLQPDGVPIDVFIAELQNLKATFKEKYSNLSLDMYSKNWESNEVLTLFGERLETDEEFRRRVETEEKNKIMCEIERERRETKERKEYERLKKKFEK